MKRLVFLSMLAGCQLGGSGEPPVPAELYDPCDFAAECPSEAEVCSRVALGGEGQRREGAICTLLCGESAECLDDGVCVAADVTTEVTTCQRSCTTAADCPENYDCQFRDTVDQDPVAVCVPTCRGPTHNQGPSFGC